MMIMVCEIMQLRHSADFVVYILLDDDDVINFVLC